MENPQSSWIFHDFPWKCLFLRDFWWQVAVPALDCACLACPHLPRVYEAFATEGFASPEPEKYMPVLCPMRLGGESLKNGLWWQLWWYIAIEWGPGYPKSSDKLVVKVMGTWESLNPKVKINEIYTVHIYIYTYIYMVHVLQGKGLKPRNWLSEFFDQCVLLGLGNKLVTGEKSLHHIKPMMDAKKA